MKTIIAGSRSITSIKTVRKAIDASNLTVTEVVSGGARGVDSLGEKWASHNHIPVKRFIADWNRHGRSAGPIRNRQMADYADALIAIWDGESRGTKNMIGQAAAKGLVVYVHRI